MVQLKLLRSKKKLTQTELAQQSGLSQAYINELENGKKSNPSFKVLMKIAYVLGVDIKQLIDDRYI